jgi:hypothetical protein
MTRDERYLAQDLKTRHIGTDNSGRPQAPKEVDRMNSIMTRKTAIDMTLIPSTFGMPACGHAFGSADVTTGAVRVQADEVRIKGDMGLRIADLAARTYPGTSAWSPPNS